jgi:hypothetical protein
MKRTSLSYLRLHIQISTNLYSIDLCRYSNWEEFDILPTMPFHPNRKEYREAQRNEANVADGAVKLPRKKFYRQRAHANIFSDHHLD